MDPSSLAEAKRALRARVRALRDAMPADERARASAAIVATVTALLPRRGAIALYAAMTSEVDLSALESIAAAKGLEIHYPRVEGERIAFRRARLAELRTGTWGIREPEAGAPEARALDLVVVPGVAFDADRARLGNGKGYYDRALRAAPPGHAVGVFFEVQRVDRVPRGPHDVVLDRVVTERSAFPALPT